MKAFEYASPASVAEAVKALAGKDGAAALGGGTDLVNRMKEGVTKPSRVVATRSIGDLAGIEQSGAGLVIKGATTLAAVLKSEPVGRLFPALRQATLEVGTPQIRNMATVAGNLLQRPRDWYFRNGFGLLGGKNVNGDIVRDIEEDFVPIDVDEATHVVRAGDNRYAAIFMTEGDALFVNTASLAPPLIALGAKATLVGPAGERTVDVADLYRVPQSAGETELVLKPGEVLTHLTIPTAATKNASYEVRHKQAHDWPLVLASVALTTDGDTVKSARVVLGSVAPIPLVCEPAAKAVTGKSVTLETAGAAGKAAAAGAKPLSMNAYKVKLVEVAVKRALLAAVGNRYWEV
jgi:xanthine dehydrogenase YagS FAD-binding subunit